MRYFMLTLLLLPTISMATEALSNAGMDKTYISATPPCLTPREGKTGEVCPRQSPTHAATEKALRDTEQQTLEQTLTNPQLNNPDIQPPPSQLPPPSVTPQQQEFFRQVDNLPRPPTP